jgi:putative phosphoesterase
MGKASRSGGIRIGVVSDTHALVRPEALARLKGVDHIVHAGDVGSPDVLAALARIAPLTAVRGNNDNGPWAKELPQSAWLELEGVNIYVIHDVHELDLDPATSSVGVLVSGHSHKPNLKRRGDVLYFNPGSIGPRRFRLPISMGFLRLKDGVASGELIELG